MYKEAANPFRKTLSKGVSKDGRFRLESVALEGAELEMAVEEEKKANICSIVSAEKGKHKVKLPHMEPSKSSNRENGVVKAYAVNTHQGTSRNYNEDRVNITLNIRKHGLKAQFFAIYDGHGGNMCCEYLKDNLHEYLIASESFPVDPARALR